jgi:adenine-specific DNA-methyltransferase
MGSVREQARLTLQEELDSQKSQAERNRLGQFATPTALAQGIMAEAVSLLPPEAPIRFLDPAIGTGAFYSALRAVVLHDRIAAAEGFEIDPHYGLPAQTLWTDTTLKLHIADFTSAAPPPVDAQRFNLIVCNPPYVRHHHIVNGDKLRLQEAAQRSCDVRLSGLAGLYCYFIAIAHAWLAAGGVGCWLVPSEFMDVNYGHAIKKYLLDQVTLLRIHRFDPSDVQFEDALVSSAVVWFRKTAPPADHTVDFTLGGTVTAPRMTRLITSKALHAEAKWTRFPASEVREKATGKTLGDLFTVKRGVATGDNKFFILSRTEIETLDLPIECFRPILPSPRYLIEDEVGTQPDGSAALTRQLYLLDCRLPEDEVKVKHPTLWRYLQTGVPQVSERYLCRHRSPWYAQEDRPPAPFVCTYIGRTDTASGRPFRFILNHSRATAANVYLLLYPKSYLARELARDPTLARRLWQQLNDTPLEVLLGEGRVYGGGLHKLEPKELSNVPAGPLLDLIAEPPPPVAHQMDIFELMAADL